MPTQVDLATYTYIYTYKNMYIFLHIYMHNLFFHPRQVTEPESEISEAGTALMMVNLWFDGTHQPAPSSCCPTHFYLGFTRFAIFLKKHPRVWFERVNSDINQIRFFCHLTNIRVTYFRSRGDVVVILGQCFQAEIPVSLFVSWFLTFVHPGPIGEVWKIAMSFLKNMARMKMKAMGSTFWPGDRPGLMADVMGIFNVFPCFLRIKWHRWRQIWSHLPCGLDNFLTPFEIEGHVFRMAARSLE